MYLTISTLWGILLLSSIKRLLLAAHFEATSEEILRICPNTG